MKKILFSLSFILLISVTAFVVKTSFLEKLADQFEQKNKKFPKEVLYLQIDKKKYMPGETIWFKGYVLDKLTRNLSARSNTLTFVLINEAGEEVSGKEFLILSGECPGNFVVPDGISTGSYRIIAFTSWMKNYSDDPVFSTEIEITNALVPESSFRILFNKKKYEADEKVIMSVQSVDWQNSPVPYMEFTYTIYHGDKELASKVSSTSKNGSKIASIKLPKKLNDLVTISIKAEKKSVQEYFAVIPTNKPDIDLRFFPEGGDLISGMSNRLAFKAVNQLGRSEDVEGQVFDSKGNKVADFSSFYLGTGDLNFVPQLGEKYYAQITKPEGYVKKYSLPEPKEGYAISVLDLNEKNCEIRLKTSFKEPQKCYLVAQSLGELLFTYEITIKKDSLRIAFPLDIFPMCLTRLTLFNSEQQAVSERLVFLNKHKKMNIQFDGLKKSYNNREKVTLNLNVTDENGKPIDALLSLAVVDSVTALDTKAEKQNIMANLLLQDDIKGRINTPDFYFSDAPKSDKALDLLLLTQGWRRFDWDKFEKRKIGREKPPIDHDVIRGTVYTRNNQKNVVPNANIFFVQLEGKTIDSFNADENGFFAVRPKYSSYHISRFLLLAKSNTMKPNVTMVIENNRKDVFRENAAKNNPALSNHTFGRISTDVNENQFFSSRAPLNIGDYIMLAEVEITDTRTGDYNPWTEINNSNPMVRTRMGTELFDAPDFVSFLRQVVSVRQYDIVTGSVFLSNWGNDYSGINISDDNDNEGDEDDFGSEMSFAFENEPKGVLFVVNGMEWGNDASQLDHLMKEDIISIQVYTDDSGMALYGLEAASGLVVVNAKNASEREVKRKRNLGVPLNRNYEAVREFYMPRYDIDSLEFFEMDTRTTIYWKHRIRTGKDGKATVSYFNSDVNGKAVGIIEGIGAAGLLGHHRFNYDSKILVTRH